MVLCLVTIKDMVCQSDILSFSFINSYKLHVVCSSIYISWSPGVGKFAVSLPLITAQGSHREKLMGRGYGNIAHASHAVTSLSVGD